MNYLWIDLWNKRCWLAYSTFWWIIFTLPSANRFELVPTLKKIIKEKSIETIVLGMPYDLYWIDKVQLDRTNKFYEKLKDIFPEIKIHTVDERFTTFEAINILNQFEKKENIKDKKDSMSAFLILESFLQKNKDTN